MCRSSALPPFTSPPSPRFGARAAASRPFHRRRFWRQLRCVAPGASFAPPAPSQPGLRPGTSPRFGLRGRGRSRIPWCSGISGGTQEPGRRATLLGRIRAPWGVGRFRAAAGAKRRGLPRQERRRPASERPTHLPCPGLGEGGPRATPPGRTDQSALPGAGGAGRMAGSLSRKCRFSRARLALRPEEGCPG